MQVGIVKVEVVGVLCWDDVLVIIFGGVIIVEIYGVVLDCVSKEVSEWLVGVMLIDIICVVLFSEWVDGWQFFEDFCLVYCLLCGLVIL